MKIRATLVALLLSTTTLATSPGPRVDYHGGLRYPHLERDPVQKPLLDEILAPRK